MFRRHRIFQRVSAAIEALGRLFAWARATALTTGALVRLHSVPVLCFIVQQRGLPGRWMAAAILGKLGDRRATPALIGALSDSYEELRFQAAEALGLLADPLSVPVLGEVLQDKSQKVRVSASKAVAAFGDDRVADFVTASLADSAPPVRANAARYLLRCGDERAAPVLALRMHDSDPQVRARAVEALGRWGDRSCIPRMAELLKDLSGDVRARSAYSLEQICRRDPTPALWRTVSTLRVLSVATFSSDREVFRSALKTIEAATSDLRDRPVPSHAPEVDPALLPHPATLAQAGDQGPIEEPEAEKGRRTRLPFGLGGQRR